MLPLIYRTMGLSDMASDMISDEFKYISLAEATEGTPYSQEYLSLLARRGKFHAKKVGRNWYTTKEAVRAYTDEQKIKLLEAVQEKSVMADIKPGILQSKRGLILEEVPDDEEWGEVPFLYKVFSSRTFRLALSIFVNTFFAGTILAGFFVVGIFGANLIHEKSFDYAWQKSESDLYKFAAVAGERVGILDFVKSRIYIAGDVFRGVGEKVGMQFSD